MEYWIKKGTKSESVRITNKELVFLLQLCETTYRCVW